MKESASTRGILGGIMIAVIGGLCISLVTGVVTYRDIVSQNKFMLTTLQTNQEDILGELKDLKSIVNGLNADYQVLKQDQLQDERDIDRLYDHVYPQGIPQHAQIIPWSVGANDGVYSHKRAA